jgi:hypothetical protein
MLVCINVGRIKLLANVILFTSKNLTLAGNKKLD